MNDLGARRGAIRHLLSDRDPADAMAAYYAFYHPDDVTTIVTLPEHVSGPSVKADAFVTLTRSGIHLFRPLVTMRLPVDSGGLRLDDSVELLQGAFAPGQPVIMRVPVQYRPLIAAVFDIQSEERMRVLSVDAARFTPILNVMVAGMPDRHGLYRYIHYSYENEKVGVAATASLNWQSPYFAEIAVTTQPEFRRQGFGRSVVAALSRHVLENGRTPLYVVSEENQASAHLAESLGFEDSGARELLLQATLNQDETNPQQA